MAEVGVVRTARTSAVAEALGVSCDAVRKLAAGGRIPFSMVGSHRRFNVEEVCRVREEAAAAGQRALAAMEPTGDVGGRLRFHRERQGLSKAALARRAGVHEDTVYRIEVGKRFPGEGTVGQLARALGVAPHELAGCFLFARFAGARFLPEWDDPTFDEVAARMLVRERWLSAVAS